MSIKQLEEKEITLKDLIITISTWLRYFLSKWKLLSLIVLIGTGSGIIKSILSKPIYTAELTLALDNEGAGNSYSGIANAFGIDLGGGKGGVFTGENNIELLKSRRMIENTLLSEIEIDNKKQLLIERYFDFQKKEAEDDDQISDTSGSYLLQFNLPRENFGRKKDSILFKVFQSMKGALTVERVDKKLAIISVKFKSRDEIFAKLFTEALVNKTIDFYYETRVKKYKKNVLVLENRLDSVRKELNNEMYGAAITKDQNQNVIRALGNIQSSKRNMNVQILSTMYGELVKNLEFAKYSLLREEPFIQIIDSPILPLEKKKFGMTKGILFGGGITGIIGLIYLTLIRFKKELFTPIK